MTPPPPLFHALLRPAVLQVLRATGYHGAKTSVLDSITDLTARYLFHLCQLTALYAAHNNDHPDSATTDFSTGITGSSSASSSVINPAVPAPTLVDVRMALQRAGALLPDRIAEEQEYLGAEDTRGVDAFVAWATGPLNREIARIALDGNDEATDYLDGEFFTCPPPRSVSLLLCWNSRTQRTLTSPNSPQKEAQQERRRLQVSRHAPRPQHRARRRAGRGG
jgi:transcription initiation factor TFIID subunit 3